MGQKPKEVKRVVLDTNILVSALLFDGELCKFVELWQKGKIIPLISKETFGEFTAVLEYPKFSLSSAEIRSIIENEVLPYFDVIEISEDIRGVCRDPMDDTFIACALSASADFLVSGDKDFAALKHYKSVKIVRASEFLMTYR
jgi:uncharacterized protein